MLGNMSRAYKVAIVEDDLAIAEMYKIKFDGEGFNTAIAQDGATGYELIKRFQPDIVLLDLMMPEMTGDQMLEKVRQENWGQMKVVVLTNISADEAPESLLHLDVSRYLVKASLTPQQVVEAIKDVLQAK